MTVVVEHETLETDMSVHCAGGLAAFAERAPWWGGDLQTLRNFIMARQSPLPSRTSALEFQVSDDSGDRLVGKLEEPLVPADEMPLVLLVHGLTGCEDSTYVRETARFHLARGRRVLRLNLRGAGPGRHVAANYYHAGCAQDVIDVVEQLEAPHVRHGILAIGYSLGGNVLLNVLAGLPATTRIIGAATVSAPIEPAQACRALMGRRNAIYHRWLLGRMKRDVLGSAALSHGERRAIQDAVSVYEFDDRWVAPRNGFAGARDYYERTAGARCVASIQTPTLLLHAQNDPWIPADPYQRLPVAASGPVRVLVARSGGHVGFHERGRAETWHDRMIEDFLHAAVLDAHSRVAPAPSQPSQA